MPLSTERKKLLNGHITIKCPPEKEKAVEDALKYFQMIPWDMLASQKPSNAGGVH